MRTEFVSSVFADLRAAGDIDPAQRVLCVAGGRAERDLFESLGFGDVVISNLDTVEAAEHLAPYEWAHEDAQCLSYPDRSFDWVVVVDGLHHCTSPHAALSEMYRVCRAGVVVVEARDSLLMRAAVRLGLTSRYELEAVIDQDGRSGGLENGPIPNHIYRWTENEFRKTVRSCDPTGEHRFRFFHALHLPYETAAIRGWGRRATLLRVADPLLRATTWLFPRQRNSIAMVATRPTDMFPWLTETGNGTIEFRQP